VLDEFVRNQGRYVRSLKSLVAAGDVVDNIVPGDYVSLLLAAQLDGFSLGQLEDLPGRDQPKAGTPKADADRPAQDPRGGLLDPLTQLSLTGLLGGLLG
jgi:hypothetical protein